MATEYDPTRLCRQSIRLQDYDYSSPGAYFVTICTRRRECVLDDPVVSWIITGVWHALPGWFPNIALDEFIVMPNHVHLIVWLQAQDDVGATLAVARQVAQRTGASPVPTDAGWIIPQPETINSTPMLSDVIGAFKSLVFTVYLDWIQAHNPSRRAKFWQRSYYDHVIRNERELHAIRHYIQDNPIQWALDRDNPDNLHRLPPPTSVEDYLADVAACSKNGA